MPEAVASRPVRVALVDDHAVMRAGFRMILEAEDDIRVVAEAADGEQAIAMAAAHTPDVICMDVRMPGLDGIEATRRILAEHPAARIVIVTTFDDDEYLFAALAAGASGFLLKNAGPEELVNAVRVIASGEALLSPEVTRRVIERFASAQPAGVAAASDDVAAAPADSSDDSIAPAAAPAAPAAETSDARIPGRAAEHAADAIALRASLTDREAEVLRLIAEPLSNAGIAGRLFIGEATVKTHVSNVLLKLGARDRVHAVVLAYRHGLV